MNFKSVTNKIRIIIVFFAFALLAYNVLSEKIFDYIVLTGLPITNISKLLVEHLAANILLFLSIFGLAIGFLKLYTRLKHKNIPFVGLVWMFSIFKFFISGIFFMNILSLWRAYYWIDVMVRLSSGIFATGALITFIAAFKYLANTKTQEQYKALREEINKAIKIYQETHAIKIGK